MRGDAWDRGAARILDASRGTNFVELVATPGAEDAVVTALYATSNRAKDDEFLWGTAPRWAGSVLLLRRTRAGYAFAASAMSSPDVWTRRTGLQVFEIVEGRIMGGASSGRPGIQFRGPEREAALDAMTRTLTSDPDAETRHAATVSMWSLLPDGNQPSVEAIATTLDREQDPEHRHWLLWLLAERKAPAPVILEQAMRNIGDPVSVAVAIHDLFVEPNLPHLEQAYRDGDAAGRAGIGETFFRHQDPMPWAEDLILKGLLDPDSDVQARFAKGALVLQPLSPHARARLESAANEKVGYAGWALSILDRRAKEDAAEASDAR